MLPDSSVNQVGSQGFFKFQIPLRNALPDASLITNSADIYFDYNPPILTNSVENLKVNAIPVAATVVPASCFDSADGQIQTQFPPGDFQFFWSDGGMGRHRTHLAPDVYHLTVVDGIGRSVSDTLFSVAAPPPLHLSVTATASTSGLNNGTLTAIANGGTPPYQYLWNTFPVQSGAYLEQLSPGDYLCQVTDANGCTIMTSATINSTTSTRIPSSEVSVLLHPNPARHQTILTYTPETPLVSLQLVDALGRFWFPDFSTDGLLLLDGLPPGSYRVVVHFKSGASGNAFLEKID